MSIWSRRTAATSAEIRGLGGRGSHPSRSADPPTPLAWRRIVRGRPGRYVRLLDDVCSGPHRTTVLVGHGGGIACLLVHLTWQGFGRYLEYVPESAGLTWIEVDEGRPRIQVMNARPTALTDHLQCTARAAR
ncbi:histidine phosphatase family protein [Streptomyces sp. NPDC059943]|uniref:histidine phosphatase family protein n=1 Tax=Streptomyces sp. NPDC059943 TaxID=3347010 RepID=UPI00365B3A66